MSSYAPAENHTDRPRLDFLAQDIQALEPKTLNLKSLLFWRSMMLANLAEKDFLYGDPGDLYNLTIALVITDDSDR